MRRTLPVIVLTCLSMCGCADRCFTHLGHGCGVPVGSLDEYARQHDVSREEARRRMLQEHDYREAREHGQKYNVPVEEARRPMQTSNNPQPRTVDR